MDKRFKNIDNISLYKWIMSSKRRIVGILLPLMFALLFVLITWTSAGIQVKLLITFLAILWEGLFVLKAGLILKRLKKTYGDKANG